MQKEIVPFNFNGSDVRVVNKDEQHWFVAKDICDVLELTDTNMAVSHLDEDEKLTQAILGSGQKRNVWTVNESGLYNLIFKSRKEKARAFRKWVTSEVLPAIRKTGSYSAVNTKSINAKLQYDKKTPTLYHPDTIMDTPLFVKIMVDYGMEGVGMFWASMEHLNKVGGSIAMEDISLIAFRYHIDEPKLQEFTEFLIDSGVYNFSEGKLHCPAIIHNNHKRLQASQKLRDAGRKGAMKRWNKTRELTNG